MRVNTSNPAGASRCVVERSIDERSLGSQNMSRIIKEIEVEGKPAVALFDTGATFTYVRSLLISEAPRTQIKRPAHVVLGGQEIDITELCVIQGKIEGLDFFADAVPVDDLGRADGHNFDA